MASKRSRVQIPLAPLSVFSRNTDDLHPVIKRMAISPLSHKRGARSGGVWVARRSEEPQVLVQLQVVPLGGRCRFESG